MTSTDKANQSVLAVIPVWNSGEDLRRCLQSLLDLQYGNIRFIVADNNSTDNIQLIVTDFKETFKKRGIPLEYMKLDDNYSHTGAVNRALKTHYRGESYILKMDSDIEIDDREILHKMISFLKNHPEAGIIGPKMKIPALNKNMVAIRWIKCLGTLIEKEQAEPIEADLVNGGFLLIQAELYKKLPYLWSEILFYGWTELDLCERARTSGYKTFFYPHATVIHKLVTWRSRSEKRIYYDLRNLLLANWKYGSACSRTANFVVLFWPRIVYWLIVRSHFNILPIIGAVKDFIVLRKKYENE